MMLLGFGIFALIVWLFCYNLPTAGQSSLVLGCSAKLNMINLHIALNITQNKQCCPLLDCFITAEAASSNCIVCSVNHIYCLNHMLLHRWHRLYICHSYHIFLTIIYSINIIIQLTVLSHCSCTNSVFINWSRNRLNIFLNIHGNTTTT